jgi:hypothetical protein
MLSVRAMRRKEAEEERYKPNIPRGVLGVL